MGLLFRSYSVQTVQLENGVGVGAVVGMGGTCKSAGSSAAFQQPGNTLALTEMDNRR